MKLKVCGMRDPYNIQEVAALNPDFMGFIFYPPSPRYLASAIDIPWASLDDILLTGVFVNEQRITIQEKAREFRLKAVQLHGNESPEFCRLLRDEGLKVLKAIPVDRKDDFKGAGKYRGAVDFFVFDTKTEAHGGSGRRFDWELLQDYTADIPFLLSGGISIDDVERIRQLQHPMLSGVDINSRFEVAPGLKSAVLLQQFIDQLS